MSRPILAAATIVVALVFSACAGRRAELPTGPLPPPAVAMGRLALRVAYPREAVRDTAGDTTYIYASPDERILSRDSVFIFGSVGRGDARLTVNGVPVPVYPTGAWLAWLPLPDDTVVRFDLAATGGGERLRATFIAYLLRRYRPPEVGVWVDTTSFAPAGARWIRPGEELRLSVRAAAGASVRLLLPDGTRVPLLSDSAPPDLPWGELAFGTAGVAQRPVGPTRFVARWTGPLGPDPGPVMAPLSVVPEDSGWAQVEVVGGADTVRRRWPLRVGVVDPARLQVVVVNDDTAGTGRPDSSLAGRPSPNGTYHWFFPTGTMAAVSGRWNGQVRLQLSRSSVAWVDAVDVQPLHPDTPPPSGVAGSPRLVPTARSVTLEVPLPARMPFRVDERDRALELRLYGVAADMDWVRYGGTDPLVRLVSFSQPVEDETVLTLELSQPVWGYRTRWAGHTLLLEVRRPPAIDPPRGARPARPVSRKRMWCWTSRGARGRGSRDRAPRWCWSARPTPQ